MTNTALDPKQEQAVFLLAAGKTITATASEIEVARGTIYHWLREPGVKAEIGRLRNEIATAYRDGFLALGGKTVKMLDALLEDPDPRIRLGAVKVWMDGLKFLVHTPMEFEEPMDVPQDNPKIHLLDDLSKLTPEAAQRILSDLGEKW